MFQKLEELLYCISTGVPINYVSKKLWVIKHIICRRKVKCTILVDFFSNCMTTWYILKINSFFFFYNCIEKILLSYERSQNLQWK